MIRRCLILLFVFSPVIALTVFTIAVSWTAVPLQAQPAARGSSFTCNVINSTATTLTAFVASGSAIAACSATPNQAMYITDITASASANATTTTDQQLEIKFGTGTACGTGTQTIWNAFALATTTVEETFGSPVRVPANTDLCWMDAVAGNKTFIVSGYYGP